MAVHHTPPACEPDIQEMLGEELTAAEEQELIEREVRRTLNISTDEFRRRWEAGDYRDDDDPRVTQVAMLLY
jgi:hypothetical protein